MSGGSVSPPVVPMTELDAREILSRPLLRLCSDLGPSAVARAVGGVDEKTIRMARDERSTLSIATAANLLALDPTAFDEFLTRVGRRSVPMDAVCTSDPMPAMTAAVHKIALAASPTSANGADMCRDSLLAAKSDIRAAFDQLGALLARIERHERGLAA